MTEHRILRLTVGGFLFCVFTLLFFRFLLPVLLPFLIALLLSQLTEPAIRLLQERWPLPRAVHTAVVMTALFSFLTLVAVLLLQGCASGLARLTERLPALMEGLRPPMEALQQWLLRAADRIPDGLGLALRAWITRLFSDTTALLGRASDLLLSLASRMVAMVPKLFLFLVTTVVASFMISAQRQSLLDAICRRLPETWRKKGCLLAKNLRRALGGWLRAEAKLMLITFGTVSLGLLLLGAGSPLLLALLTALVDALPVLGTGTILIPWGLWNLLQGKTFFGAGILVLYGITAALRTALEPRLVGRQIGLQPLAALLAMYAGFQLFGLGGMILLPICAILAKQLWTFGFSGRSEA